MGNDPARSDHAIELSEDLKSLTELLAKNTHEVWARQRIADGWVYGPARDDKSKEHPGLIQYDDLPPSEKQYDRNTALGTLQLIRQLGFDIVRRRPESLGHAERVNAVRRHGPFIDRWDASEIIPAAASAPVAKAIKNALSDLGRVFDAADTKAIQRRRQYRLIAIVASVFGTLAVLFAILQLPQAFSLVPHLPYAELVAAVLAGVSVVLGLSAALHPHWLLERHRAERCKFLKFAFAIDPDLWSSTADRIQRALSRLQAGIDDIRGLTAKSMEEWIVEDRIPPVPTVEGRMPHDLQGLAVFRDYYLGSRVRDQRDYFRMRYDGNRDQNDRTRLIPPVLFFTSVLCVLIHSILEFSHRSETIATTTLIVLAAALPVIGAGIRTYRTAFEFSRNGIRFRAKFVALDHLVTKIEDETDVVQFFNLLWICEQILESEHREWLRLMLDAEWFG